MDIIYFGLAWIVLAFFCGYIAKTSYGRPAMPYAIFALVFSPLLAFLILFIVGKTDQKIVEDKERLDEQLKQQEKQEFDDWMNSRWSE